MKLLSIKETAEKLGITTETLRNWDRSGELVAERTKGGHRRYREEDVFNLMGEPPKQQNSDSVAVYCRVSSGDQKDGGDLDRQKGRVLQHCVEKQYPVKFILEEVSSGMNDNRPKLKKLMELARSKQINRVVVEHSDRLIRFNKKILIGFFQSHGVEVEFMEQVLSKSFENELVEDMLSLLVSFSAKIYGKRSSENRRKAK